jgi:glycosyltransferase involved in cell wall biosynthesis
MKILVFTTDLPPLPGSPTSGTALRTFNLAEGLRELGHEVVLSPPRSAMDGYTIPADASPELKEYITQLRKLSFDASTQAARIHEIMPTLIICGHWPAWTLARKPKQPLIIDLAGPHLLERHYQGEDNFDGAVYGKLNALSSADYFIVSGNKQKLYFLSFLLKANIPNPEKRICTIPMPLPSASNSYDELTEKKQSFLTHDERIKDKTFPHFIFGGVFLPWQDPSHGLEILAAEVEKRGKGILSLIGGPHPHYKINSGKYDALFDSIEKNPRATRKPLLPYEQFLSLLPGVDVALDLMSWNLERELAITIRTTTYLWAGVPIIYNDFADLSEYIRAYDAGWCIPPDNKEALLKVLHEIYENPDLVKEKSRNAFRLAAEIFDRKKSAQKIFDLLALPQVPLEDQIDILMDLPESCDLILKSDAPLEQHFTCRMNGLQEVAILFATHNTVPDGDLEISLYHKKESPGVMSTTFLHSSKKSASEIKNNEWVHISLPPILDSAGKEYVLKIHRKGITNDRLGPWTMKSSPYPLKGLFEKGKRQGVHSLCIKTNCAKTEIITTVPPSES